MTNLITNHSQSGRTIPVLVVPFFLFTSTFHKLRMFLKKKYVTVSNFVGCCDKKVLVRSCQLLDLLVWTLTNWISFISVWMKIHTVNLDRAMLATVTRLTLSEYSKLLTELYRMQSGSWKRLVTSCCEIVFNFSIIIMFPNPLHIIASMKPASLLHAWELTEVNQQNCKINLP